MKVIKYIIILTFIISAGVVKAQAPDWSVNPNDYSYSMTITGVINTDYTESVDENDLIAVFVSDECRGVVNPVYSSLIDRYVCFLMVYSNESAETLNFKIYKAGSDAVLDIETTKTFEVNGFIGNLERPYVWSNPTLNDAADILTFSFPEDEQAAVIEGTNVDVLVKWGTDISSLTATYTLSEGADFLLDAVGQQSGVTTNDFSEPLVFTVRSEDEQLYLDYTITVSVMPNTAPEAELGFAEVAEATETGSVIFTVVASDYDNDVLSYSIAEESVSERFEINSATGEISLLQAFDFETEDSYILTIEVNDSYQTVETTVEFQVTDSPEEPVVENAEVTITEATPIGIDILYPIAYDVDAGDVLSYSIAAGNDEGKFSIDSETGKVTVAQELDFETTNEYNLTIDVTDGIYTIPLLATVYIVDVQENPNAENLLVDVDENEAAGTVLGTVVATDPDLGDVLTYSFAIYSVMDEFVINAETGEISLALPLNYESENFYTLAVEITDGVFIEVATVEVTVNDVAEQPVVQDASGEVSEFAEIGTSIVNVIASDPDNDALTYSFQTTNDVFAIDAESGAITLNAVIDFETTASYSFVIEVTDGIFTLESAVDISVINIPENPVVENQSAEISEFAEIGASVMTVAASDPDNDVLTYEIPYYSQSDYFEINTETGEITVMQTLDYETTQAYELVVQVIDPVFTEEITVDISVIDIPEEPIVEESVLAEVSEFAEIGTVVYSIEANDPDNDALTFTFTNESSQFTINSETGEITLEETIDYEVQSEYTFTVQVADGVFVMEVPVTIAVINIPEEPVVEDFYAEVYEDITEGTSIGTVIATDADNDILYYAFTEESDADNFAIDELTGEITLANELDYETMTAYDLTVEVSDPVFIKSVSVTIMILDVPEDILPAVNAFTPDGDGVNDYWYIENAHIYEGYDLYIFNPAGKEIFHTNSYQNDWDGTYDGSPLPRGTYYYLFKGNGNVYKGTISIIRR